MTDQKREQVKVFLEEFHIPRYNELPDFGIRLEQITKYVGRYSPGVLTGSMVSNYVKQKLIPAPVRKNYSRESIAYLIFVSYIKTVMSMEDIRLLIDLQTRTYPLKTAYNYFCDEFENLLWYVCGLKSQPDPVGVTDTEAKDLLRTALMSITYKVYLEQSMALVRTTLLQNGNENI